MEQPTIEIWVTERHGYRYQINDLYWFEENFVHWFDDSNHTFEIFINGIKYPRRHIDPRTLREVSVCAICGWQWNDDDRDCPNCFPGPSPLTYANDHSR